MDNYSFQIAQLIQENGTAVTNQGLFNGNVGRCIFFYHLAKDTNNLEYERIADDLLNQVFENISASAYLDFEDGLTGIGWGIEYLLQNKFAEGETDEILKEIDDRVFKSLNEENPISFELTNGLTGHLFYLISRLKKPFNPNSMSQRINRELIILTINKLDVMVTAQFSSIIKEQYFDLFWRFPVMFYGLVQAFELNIYNEKIRCMINQWLMYLEAYIPSIHINRLYLAMTLSQVIAVLPNKRLEKQIQILLYAIDFEILKSEVDQNAFNIRYGWPGFVWIMRKALLILPVTYPNYKLIHSVFLEIMLKYKSTLDNIPENFVTKLSKLGLSEGLSGIGMMEILERGILLEECMLKPI